MGASFPPEVFDKLQEHHRGGITEQDCAACCSGCCSRGSFAIFENVVSIYELYKDGRLHREDFEFEPELSFKDFVDRYFDVYLFDPGEDVATALALFHMKNVSCVGHLISIPSIGDFWETRDALYDGNPWLNRGCVFLSRTIPDWPTDDGDSDRHCILHQIDSATHLGPKPIDCVFFTCDSPMTPREPAEPAHKWLEVLRSHYPEGFLSYVERMKRD